MSEIKYEIVKKIGVLSKSAPALRSRRRWGAGWVKGEDEEIWQPINKSKHRSSLSLQHV
jgi:hypothetical protein